VATPWDIRLSRPLMLKSGRRLVTLRDVRSLFIMRYSGVTHSAALTYAGELLLKAAATGRWPDIVAATDQIEVALMRERLLQ
jgi:hypothetical protein